MVNPVKEFLQVNVHDVLVSLMDILLGLPDGIMGPAFGSKPVAVGRKVRVEDGCEHLENGLLDEPVYHGRDTQQPDTSVRFWDFDPSDRCWLVGSLQQLVFNGWPVLPEIISEVFS
jgi:hypothetical protein